MGIYICIFRNASIVIRHRKTTKSLGRRREAAGSDFISRFSRKDRNMSQQRSDLPPAIVLGVGESALGAIRSLRRRGIRAAYASDKRDIAAWSRFAIRLDNYPDKALSPDDLADWLKSTGLESAVLVPCSDAWVESVAELDETVIKRFHRWSPSPDVVSTMIDKNRFRAVLEQLKLPHPRSFPLDRDPEKWEFPESVLKSAFLKPYDSLSFFGAFGIKAMFVSSHDEACAKAQLAWDKDIDLLVQEYVPGPPQNHYFIDGFRSKDGSTTHFLARQRLRMYPPDFGNSTSMITVPLDSVEPALETLRTLFDFTSFHGIFSAEFKLDEQDNDFKIIEVNCRPWWFVDYADRCGLHVCEAACLDATGHEVLRQQAYRIGKLGTYPIYDWEVFRSSDSRSLIEFLKMILNWMRSYQTVFTWSDPMPAIVNFSRLLKGAVRRRVHNAFQPSTEK